MTETGMNMNTVRLMLGALRDGQPLSSVRVASTNSRYAPYLVEGQAIVRLSGDRGYSLTALGRQLLDCLDAFYVHFEAGK